MRKVSWDVDDVINLFHDYEVDQLSVNKLSKKYHISPNTVDNLLKRAGILRSHMVSAKNQHQSTKNSLAKLFIQMPDESLVKMAELGIKTKDLASVFNMSDKGKLFKTRIKELDYVQIRRQSVKNMR